MKKQILILTFIILFLPFISGDGESFGRVAKGECMKLKMPCDNCTFVNITSIQYPNSSDAVSNSAMTKDGTEYNYTFCETYVIGFYNVYTFGDDDGFIDTRGDYFEVTGTGQEFNQARSTFYIGIIVLLLFLFIGTLFTASKLPDKDPTDDYGMLISINHLKYLRPVLLTLAWMLLLGILFISANISLAYLGTDMVGNLLFNIYIIMFWTTIIAVPIMFIYTLVGVFKDKEVQKMIERGVEIPGP